MPQGIKTIELTIKLGIIKLGTVNCYLVKNGTDYVLIDTGPSNKRFELEKELKSEGCNPGNLKLIVITHGDFDHTGNASYLREKFDTKIAMHHDDLGMAESGDMFWNRNGNFIIRRIAHILFRFGKSERFKPDLYIGDRDDFSEYGFDAEVIYLPGHSLGSVGILTASRDIFCGDLLTNTDKPTLNSIMDDSAEAKDSVEKLKKLDINTVYPGHGKPFSMDMFIKSNNSE